MFVYLYICVYDRYRRDESWYRWPSGIMHCKVTSLFLLLNIQLTVPRALKVPNRVLQPRNRVPKFLLNTVIWTQISAQSLIPIQISAQSRNPAGYFRHPASRAYFQSRISSPFCFKIPNPNPQRRKSRIPKTYWKPSAFLMQAKSRLSFGVGGVGRVCISLSQCNCSALCHDW